MIAGCCARGLCISPPLAYCPDPPVITGITGCFGNIIRSCLAGALPLHPSSVCRPDARQGHVRHQLGGAGRAWRLLSGARRRHLQEIRPRRHHRSRRAECRIIASCCRSARSTSIMSANRCSRSTRSSRRCRPSRSPQCFQKDPQVFLVHPGSGHRDIRRSEKADPAGLEGRAGRLFPMAEEGLRLHRQDK